jgi:ATP-binding cassette subfamily B protein IrtB
MDAVNIGTATVSGSEKQRLSIARTLLKDHPMLVLDQATALVDPENEAFIQNAINSLPDLRQSTD